MRTIHSSNFVPGMVLLGVETALGIAQFGTRFVIETVTTDETGVHVEVSTRDNNFTIFRADPSVLYAVDTLAPADRAFAVHYQKAGVRDILDVTAKSQKEAKRKAIQTLGEGIYISIVAAV